MKEVLLVGLGSFLGGAGRYLLTTSIRQAFPSTLFPLGTFLVNLIGCFLIGTFFGLAGNRVDCPEALRLFTIAGVLGGFTTFSAFGYETVQLVLDGEILLGISNIAFSVFICLLAVYAGIMAGEAV